jgi:hypothetical protein
MSEEEKKEVSERQEDGKWKILTNAPKLNKSAVTLIDLHDDTLQTMVEWTSEQQVKDSALDSWIISAQSRIRNRLKNGKSNEEIQEEMNTFKPDVTVRGVADPIQSTLGKFAKMSSEEQEAFMAALKERLAARG